MVQMKEQNRTKDNKSKIKEEPAALKIAGFDVVVFDAINLKLYDCDYDWDHDWDHVRTWLHLSPNQTASW
jgi:hypothetical protein